MAFPGLASMTRQKLKSLALVPGPQPWARLFPQHGAAHPCRRSLPDLLVTLNYCFAVQTTAPQSSTVRPHFPRSSDHLLHWQTIRCSPTVGCSPGMLRGLFGRDCLLQAFHVQPSRLSRKYRLSAAFLFPYSFLQKIEALLLK